ncbi:MAG: 4'-phosphopantetheinyl transferase superfamily protein [Pseudomonadota bacterium]
MPDLAALAQAARHLLPAQAEVGWADPGKAYPLLAGEALPRAVPVRLREFAAGRHAARTALHRIGAGLTALPMADDRAPVWPAGITGSITHTRSACLAAVVRLGPFVGIGLDLEEDTPLDPDLWDSVLGAEEQHWLARQTGDRGGLAKRMFSAKEAAYKAQYAQSQTLFGFDGMAVALTDAGFTATFRQAVAPFAEGDSIHGRLALIGGHILTTATVPV